MSFHEIGESYLIGRESKPYMVSQVFWCEGTSLEFLCALYGLQLELLVLLFFLTVLTLSLSGLCRALKLRSLFEFLWTFGPLEFFVVNFASKLPRACTGPRDGCLRFGQNLRPWKYFLDLSIYKL